MWELLDNMRHVSFSENQFQRWEEPPTTWYGQIRRVWWADTAYLKVRYLELMLFRIRRYKMTRLLKRSNCWSVDSRLLNIPEKRDLLEIKLRDHHPETLINWIILENRQERFANKQNKNIILIIETSRTFGKAS